MRGAANLAFHSLLALAYLAGLRWLHWDALVATTSAVSFGVVTLRLVWAIALLASCASAARGVLFMFAPAVRLRHDTVAQLRDYA